MRTNMHSCKHQYNLHDMRLSMCQYRYFHSLLGIHHDSSPRNYYYMN